MNGFWNCCCSKTKDANEFKENSEASNYFDNSDQLSKIKQFQEEANSHKQWIKSFKEEDKSQKNSIKQTNQNTLNTLSKSPLQKDNPFSIKDKGLHYYNNSSNLEEEQLCKSLNQLDLDKSKSKKDDLYLMLMNNYSTVQTDLSGLFAKESIPKEVIASNMKIVISEVEGNQLAGSKGLLHINAGGLVNGAREKRDGVALFGWSSKNSLGQTVNDFAFDRNVKNYNSESTLFLIYFNQQKEKYFIRCYYESLSAYMATYALSPFMIKISKPYPLQAIEFLMVGDIFIVVTVDKDKGLLKITKKKSKKYSNSLEESFNIEHNQLITLGRDSSCTIPFPENKSFSKVHCSFYYNRKEATWSLHDGIDNKPSTNGVWLVPKKSFKIYNGMFFKVLGCTKCQINYSY